MATLYELKTAIENSIRLRYAVHFEGVTDNGEWEKAWTRCHTLQEANLKVEAINKRMDMRNPVIKEI